MIRDFGRASSENEAFLVDSKPGLTQFNGEGAGHALLLAASAGAYDWVFRSCEGNLAG